MAPGQPPPAPTVASPQVCSGPGQQWQWLAHLLSWERLLLWEVGLPRCPSHLSFPEGEGSVSQLGPLLTPPSFSSLS